MCPCPHLLVVLNWPREIIDESDVFIDVHKAIRRMTPAPKSRVPKGRVVEEPVKVPPVADGDSADADVNSKSTELPEDDRHQNSVEAPPPRFQLRKQYSDPNSRVADGWVTHRGATDEIRRQLKYLGPSNLASRPRQTRYQNVKIKRGSMSSRPGKRRGQTGDVGRSMSDTPRYVPSTGFDGGIGAGILHSAGQDAKDGAYTLQGGYGTMSPPATAHSNPPPANDFSQISVPEVVTEEQDDRNHQDDRTYHSLAVESTAVSIHSSDSQSGDRHKPAGTYMHRGPARSGSITEHVVDVNGIRKVVLHTTSSPSSSETEGRAPSHKSHPHDRPSPPSPDAKGDETQSTTRNSNGNVKKKRRRKRHGNSSKTSDRRSDDEQQPLL